MPAKAHLLKTWPEHFAAVCSGSKTFEVRSTVDRIFQVGDYLDLRCWDPQKQEFTGDRVVVGVRHILEGPPFLPEGTAVMGIQRYTGQVERNIIGAIAAFGVYADPSPNEVAEFGATLHGQGISKLAPNLPPVGEGPGDA